MLNLPPRPRPFDFTIANDITRKKPILILAETETRKREARMKMKEGEG